MTAMAEESSGELSKMTLSELQLSQTEVAVICFASTEPHGPHLPYGTDFYIGDGITRRAVQEANAQGHLAVMLPTIPIGNNVNFKQFPFACRIRVRTLMNVILDIIEQLEEDGVRKIILLNSHGGNIDTLKAAMREHHERPTLGTRAFVCCCNVEELMSPEVRKRIVHASDHAGEEETSMMMHLQPGLVRRKHLGDFRMNLPCLQFLQKPEVCFIRPWHLYVPASAGGETSESSAEKGEAFINSAAANLAKIIVELSSAPWSGNFPYQDESSGH